MTNIAFWKHCQARSGLLNTGREFLPLRARAPGAARSGPERPGAGRSGPERAGAGRSGPERPGAGRSGPERAGAGQSGYIAVDTDTPLARYNEL